MRLTLKAALVRAPARAPLPAPVLSLTPASITYSMNTFRFVLLVVGATER